MKIEKLKVPMDGFEYQIGAAFFSDLITAGLFAMEHNIPLELNEEKAGFDLGGMAVAVNEGRLDAGLIARALLESTDSAYKEGAQKLITALQRFIELA